MISSINTIVVGKRYLKQKGYLSFIYLNIFSWFLSVDKLVNLTQSSFNNVSSLLWQ